MKRCTSLDALIPALFLSIALLGLTPPGACSAQQRVDIVPDDVALLIARIEAPQSPRQRELDSLSLAGIMEHFHVPGMSVAVIQDFKVHWVKSYGVADVETGRAVDEGTLFQAASISKPVTAMAALRLAQEGRFSLDDDVNALLKSWKVPTSALTSGGPVSPRSLFSHSSGSDDGFGFPGYDPSAARPTVVQILNGVAPSNTGPVLFARPPYQAMKYSGGGLTIMQLALTDFTGVPFPELLRQKVLGPLGMEGSTYEQPLPDAIAPKAARAHNGAGLSRVAPWHVYPELAAAGLWTTPSDLARFVIEVQKAYRGPAGAVLTQASAREMIAPVGVGAYSVGLSLERRGEGWYFSHGGSNWGFRALIVGHVRNGYGLAVMTNGDNGSSVVAELQARVAAAYGWDALNKPLPR
ncbi:MAG TPA: serine hydrolase domain-containing protein [Longimicrobiales bacterium]|nr:serine hydrolase domain-containing protein [Longimicrobiales bacterium]